MLVIKKDTREFRLFDNVGKKWASVVMTEYDLRMFMFNNVNDFLLRLGEVDRAFKIQAESLHDWDYESCDKADKHYRRDRGIDLVNSLEFLRTLNCLGGYEFEEIFGDDWEKYHSRIKERGLFKFLCYLDNCNLESVEKFINAKIARRVK